MKTIRYSAKFKKDYKRCKKRGLPLEELSVVLDLLVKGTSLPEKYHDHELVGNYSGHRECHIMPDWLLVYRLEDEEVIITAVRIGSHAD